MMEPLGAIVLCTLVVRAFRRECLCINQSKYIRTVKTEQALRQGAPVSHECIEIGKTAKLLREGVIADQKICLRVRALTLLNHNRSWSPEGQSVIYA